MAEVMRDNGIMAYYTDMFEVARKNLGDAVAIRDNDPETEYFYGKTLETLGRWAQARCSVLPESRSVWHAKAGVWITPALRDRPHGGPKHLDSKRVSAELDNYVAARFQYLPEERKAEFLAPSIRSIYDYMSLYSPVE
jgi:hypothetical protein